MLNLPKNKFLMKANLVNKKIKINNLFYLNNKILNFFLFDGPPFANGELHIGHILNKTIKDVLISFFLKKKKILLSNLGWDCHGLPIEQLNLINNFFFLNCKYFVCKMIKLQKKDINNFYFKNNYFTYNTMEPRYESFQYKIFNFLTIKDIIITENIPILWCFKCISSLSYSEILYKKINSYSYYLKIKFLNFFLIIWTTTLWSIINNQSIFFLKKQIYIILKTKKIFLIFLNHLILKILKILKIKGKVFSFFNGIFFLKKKYFLFLKNIIFFYNKKNIFLEYKFIDINIGSGFIHCAPSNGIEDFNFFKNKKKIFNFFNKKCFIKNFSIFKNINLFFLNKIFFKFLKKRKILIKSYKINHSYMFCWRHKKPIFYFLSKQIFINLNLNFKKLKIKNILFNFVKKIKFFPYFIKKNLLNMIRVRSNWCISRQRYWGIPIILNKNLSFYKNITKTFSSHIFIYIYQKKLDIFDVWFDSSILSIFFNKEKIIIEGKDQIRGWYQSLIIVNFFIYFNLKIKILISHNFCIDLSGNKLSKSSKNFKTLKNILFLNSSEIIKLFLLEHDFFKNIIFDNNILLNSNFTYKIIRNFLKFLINNFYDFNLIKKQLLIFDYWIIKKNKNLLNFIKNIYLNFNFYKIIKILKIFINFINDNYFIYIKYNLYICKKYSIIRNSCILSIYNILIFLKKTLFPILFLSSNELNFFFKNKILKIFKKKIFFSQFLKLKKIFKKKIIFFKNFILLKKIKNEFINFYNEKIFFNNNFWNWINKNFFQYKNKKKYFCNISKNLNYKNNFLLKKKICKNCLINNNHNFEEIRIYV